MPARVSATTKRFTEEGGDALLLTALEQVPLPESGHNSRVAYTLADGSRVGYNDRLAVELNTLIQQRGLNMAPFSGGEVKKRLDGLSLQLGQKGLQKPTDTPERRWELRITALRYGMDSRQMSRLAQAQPPVQSTQASNPWEPMSEYASASSALPPPAAHNLLEPSLDAPGPSNLFDEHARSRAIVARVPEDIRGHLHTYPAHQQHQWVQQNQAWLRENGYLSLGGARPLRHAVIYGEGRRRF
ncbi:hypothetical protein JCM8547_000007 [Rhodosporidiobolus lusitaniae]